MDNMDEKLKGKPVMELYSIKKDEVIQFIQKNHGELRYLNELVVGDKFIDYLYLVGKK